MDLKPKAIRLRDWPTGLSKDCPEIFCISRPYIDQYLKRSVISSDPDSVLASCSWSDHHHGHYGPQRSEIEVRGDWSEGFSEKTPLRMKENLRYREEDDCLVVVDVHSAYVVNNSGKALLGELEEEFDSKDFKKICRKVKIPDDQGESFLQKLILFGLVVCRR